MQDQDLSKIITSYFNNEITTAELQELGRQANLSDNEKLDKALEELWTSYDSDLDIDEILKSEILNKINTSIGIAPKVKRRYMFYFRRIAAILVIMFMSYQLMALYVDKSNLERLIQHTLIVKTNKGERTRLVLPDSTKVLLNSESTIQYPINFGKDDRKIIFSGEAFFEVAKDSQKKFIVNTAFLDIEVLGTTFNVRAYDYADILEVNLLSGQVQVSTKGENRQSVLLLPNQKSIFNKQTNSLTVEESNHRLETSWIEPKTRNSLLPILLSKNLDFHFYY